MHRQPIARLREKKACPMALSMTRVVTFEKSGFRRKCRPSRAPGMLNEQATSTTMITSSSGIITLLKRSMPDCTPRAMTTWVIAMKIHPYTTGHQGCETKDENPALKSCSAASAPVHDCTR